jgi:hypothetical protein
MVSKDKVVAKIEKLTKEMEAISVSMEDSVKAKNEMTEMLGDLDKLKAHVEEHGVEKYHAMVEMSGKAMKAVEIEMLKKTLDLELFKLDTSAKYLIVDGPLLSPSGFHPSELVFVKRDVVIHTNKLPRSLSSNLKAYDVKELAKECA